MPTRILFAWFVLVMCLALYSRAGLVGRRAGHCSLDGVPLVGVHQVDLMRGDETLSSFCSIECAAEWPEVPEGSWWRVRDELTGVTVDAREASFVESRVVTVRSRQGRVHVFARGRDAMAHAAEFSGRIVPSPLTSQ